MAIKRTGISRDLLIHPGETILEVLEDRGLTQVDLAVSTGVSTAHVCNVIAGKKDISASFACALEYALGVPKSFWMNLQVNYDAQLMELNEENTVTQEEVEAKNELHEVIRYLKRIGRLDKDDSIIALRKALQMSNISNLRNMVPDGVFKMSSNSKINPTVMGAWIRLCQINRENAQVKGGYDYFKLYELVAQIKQIMFSRDDEVLDSLTEVFSYYGIDFSYLQSFKGAPVQGYASVRSDGTYQMVLTSKDTHADVFWYSLFHELGHIVNGDVSKNSKFVDSGIDMIKEKAADKFARDMLISSTDYQVFENNDVFEIEEITRFASSQNVKPYIVIGRLISDNKVARKSMDEFRDIYSWVK